MTTFPGSLRLLKGAIVAVDPLIPIPRVIIFQYNPEKLSRSLEAQTVGGEGNDRSQPLRIKGPPVETITFEAVELDATDQLEQAGMVNATGIYPQLAALELLVYPSTFNVIANAVLALTGTIEVIPPEAPLTLLIWGPQRVVPVRISQFSIREEAFDPSLNPIRASLTLGLRVLTYNDLPLTNIGYHLSLANQVIKEAMAAVGMVSSLSATAASILAFELLYWP